MCLEKRFLQCESQNKSQYRAFYTRHIRQFLKCKITEITEINSVPWRIFLRLTAIEQVNMNSHKYSAVHYRKNCTIKSNMYYVPMLEGFVVREIRKDNWNKEAQFLVPGFGEKVGPPG